MGFFDRLKTGLKKTSQKIGDAMGALAGFKVLEEGAAEDLEAALLAADLGPALCAELMETVRRSGGEEISVIKAKLASTIQQTLEDAQDSSGAQWLSSPPKSKPQVILVSGVNGAGKTTTCGKLAAQWSGHGEKILLAAGDTFRAAAVEQLALWAKRANAEIFIAREGAEPAAVAFDAIQKAKESGADRVLIDTAGRLQTREGLMQELAKVIRVCAKALPGAPHQGLLVLDGTSGQNMITQVQEFKKIAAPTGLVITKLDGSAKAGAVVQVVKEFGIPVVLLGVGESLEDLQPYRAADFSSALMGIE